MMLPLVSFSKSPSASDKGTGIDVSDFETLSVPLRTNNPRPLTPTSFGRADATRGFR